MGCVDRRKVTSGSGSGAKKNRHQICTDGGNQGARGKTCVKQHGADAYNKCNNDANRRLRLSLSMQVLMDRRAAKVKRVADIVFPRLDDSKKKVGCFAKE